MAFSSTLRASLILSAFVASMVSVEGHWIFGGTRPIITERVDPLVDAGQIGGHVHAVVGGSRFSETYDYNTLIGANCSTIEVQPDKSNYWAPQLYHHDQETGQFTAMPTAFNVYYLPRNGPQGQPIKAFPAGLRMVAGDTNRRTYNASSFADQAVSFVCLDYNTDHSNDPDWAERPNFFDHNCPDGMRAQIYFPSCWDGVNLDSDDHKSHMSYQIQNYNSGDCPASHPVQLVSIFYEMIVSVDQFSYWGNGTWVFSNGDPTGYGMHGDFQNGWADLDLLQNAIDNCPNANGDVQACPPLAAAVDQDAANACVIEGQIVNEDVGLTDSIASLPGCNPIWDGTGTRPTCPNTATPALVDATTPLPAGWTNLGCIAEGTNGRALTAASTTDPAMTNAKCAAFCDSKGFTYAGSEYSDECYCGNSFSNGASSTPVTWSQCDNKCAGNINENCGGPQRLTLMYNPTPGKTPLSSAAPSASASASVSKSYVTSPAVTSSVSVGVPSVSLSVSSVRSIASSISVASSVVAPSLTSSKLASVTSSLAVASSLSVSKASASPSISSVFRSSSTAAPSHSTTLSNVAVAQPSSTAVASGSLPAGWNAAGCVTDIPARALNGFSIADDQMTAASCVSTCASKGFSMAGIEYGRECYCGDEFVNGGGAALPASVCNFPCAADASATCGGNWALTLFTDSSSSSSSSSSSGNDEEEDSGSCDSAPTTAPTTSNSTITLPAGWVADGCVSDNLSRTLNAYAYTGADMTVSACVATCAAKGFALAGLEYSRECYCGNEFVNGGGAPLAASACNMTCPTDGNQCGGPLALNVYKKTTTSTRRTPKAKHFGRSHGFHSNAL